MRLTYSDACETNGNQGKFAYIKPITFCSAIAGMTFAGNG